MATGCEDALPNPHHLDLVARLAEEIRRPLDRLGRLRGLVTVRLGATGAYRIEVTPAASLRLGDLTDRGMGLRDAMAILDDVHGYDPAAEAAVLVVERNPIDGDLLTFLVQEIAVAR